MPLAPERGPTSHENHLTLVLDNPVAVPSHFKEVFRKARDVSYFIFDCN